MAFDLRDGFGMGFVHLVRPGFVLFLLALDVRRGDFAVIEEEIAQFFAGRGVVRDAFGDDVAGAVDRVLDRRHLFGYVFLRFFLYVERFVLRKNGVRERLQSARDGDGRAGLALLLIRAVDVLRLRERGCLFERVPDLVRHLALFFDGGGDLLLALFQIAEVFQPVGEFTKDLVVTAARHFLAVTGDEGNGVSLVEQRKDVLRVGGSQVEFPGNRL